MESQRDNKMEPFLQIIFNEDKKWFESLSHDSSLLKNEVCYVLLLILKQIYNEDENIAREIVALAIWKYAIIVDSKYHSYSKIGREYEKMALKYISDECKKNKIEKDLIKEIASILHWKRIRTFSEYNEGDQNPWTRLMPLDWELYNVGSIIYDNDDSEEHLYDRDDLKELLYDSDDLKELLYDSDDLEEPLYDSDDLEEPLYDSDDLEEPLYDSDDLEELYPPKQFILIKESYMRHIRNIDIECDWVEKMRNFHSWNIFKYYCIPSVFKNEVQGALIIESLDFFLRNEYNKSMEFLVRPLSRIFFSAIEHKSDLLSLNEAINSRDRLDDDDFNPFSIAVMKMEGISIERVNEQWITWRKIEKAPKEIYNLVYAICFKMFSNKNDYFQYFYNKLSDSPSFIKYLDNFNKLIELFSKCDDKLLIRYMTNKKYAGVENKIDTKPSWEVDEDEEYSLDVDSIGPRSIETMVVDLDLPFYREQFVESEETYVTSEVTRIAAQETASKGNHLFVKVRESKVKGTNQEEKNINLIKSLFQLCDELQKKGMIDSNTDAHLFVYRFSGKGMEQYPLSETIKWKGKNLLLGHLIRCLISDQHNPPMNFKTASTFFISDSGKDINLASAKYVDGKDFDNNRSFLSASFVEAVEILRRCGFTNVEFTSMRRQTLQKGQK